MLPTPQYGWRRAGFEMPPGGLAAIGQGVTSQQITSTVGGSIMASAGPIALINPIAGAIVAGVGALTSLIGGLFKPDVTKEEATAIVNQIESEHLQPNLQNWESAPTSAKTPQAQAAALAVVDASLNAVQQGCSNPQLGTAGQRCISERLIHGGTAPWCPQPGHTGCDWITLYRDPIANDPAVAANVAAATSAGSETTNTSSPGASGSNTSSTTLSASVTAPSKTFLYVGLGLVAFALGYALTGDE